jgi:uncharacterized metal-binding protein
MEHIKKFLEFENINSLDTSESLKSAITAGAIALSSILPIESKGQNIIRTHQINKEIKKKLDITNGGVKIVNLTSDQIKDIYRKLSNMGFVSDNKVVLTDMGWRKTPPTAPKSSDYIIISCSQRQANLPIQWRINKALSHFDDSKVVNVIHYENKYGWVIAIAEIQHGKDLDPNRNLPVAPTRGEKIKQTIGSIIP